LAPRRAIPKALAQTIAGLREDCHLVKIVAAASSGWAADAGVAEWQTRQTQNLLSERTWEFKSPRPHHPKMPHTA
jgi:hypothetical protein